ncbi:hypothetical protein SDC9_186187 [bioreactor metagenome]|uniref:Uncharacterized protein n=1 Tax=bioreactor metagenome TaxID=1076179 RepID=A0A645HTF9_9ZZZZ
MALGSRGHQHRDLDLVAAHLPCEIIGWKICGNHLDNGVSIRLFTGFLAARGSQHQHAY